MKPLATITLIMATALGAPARDVKTENAWLEWAGYGAYPDDFSFVDHGTPNEKLVCSNRVTSAAAEGVNTNDAAFIAWYADRVAEQNEAARLPQVFQRGIEIPYGKLFVLTAYTNGAGYQVFTDDEGFIYTSRVHGSPWLSDAEIEAARLDKIAEAKAARANYRANSGDGHNIAERVAAIEALLNLQIGND